MVVVLVTAGRTNFTANWNLDLGEAAGASEAAAHADAAPSLATTSTVAFTRHCGKET